MNSMVNRLLWQRLLAHEGVAAERESRLGTLHPLGGPEGLTARDLDVEQQDEEAQQEKGLH